MNNKISDFWWDNIIEELWRSEYMDILYNKLWQPLRNISITQIRTIDEELKKIL